MRITTENGNFFFFPFSNLKRDFLWDFFILFISFDSVRHLPNASVDHSVCFLLVFFIGWEWNSIWSKQKYGEYKLSQRFGVSSFLVKNIVSKWTAIDIKASRKVVYEIDWHVQFDRNSLFLFHHFLFGFSTMSIIPMHSMAFHPQLKNAI